MKKVARLFGNPALMDKKYLGINAAIWIAAVVGFGCFVACFICLARTPGSNLSSFPIYSRAPFYWLGVSAVSFAIWFFLIASDGILEEWAYRRLAEPLQRYVPDCYAGRLPNRNIVWAWFEQGEEGIRAEAHDAFYAGHLSLRPLDCAWA